MRIEKKKQKSLKKFLNLLVDMIIQIKDNNGNDYIITDVKSFYQHILDYHSSGTSIHEENGHYFTVDDVLRSQIEKIYQNNS